MPLAEVAREAEVGAARDNRSDAAQLVPSMLTSHGCRLTLTVCPALHGDGAVVAAGLAVAPRGAHIVATLAPRAQCGGAAGGSAAGDDAAAEVSAEAAAAAARSAARAAALVAAANPEAALAVCEAGLRLVPRHAGLLQRRAEALLEMGPQEEEEEVEAEARGEHEGEGDGAGAGAGADVGADGSGWAVGGVGGGGGETEAADAAKERRSERLGAMLLRRIDIAERDLAERRQRAVEVTSTVSTAARSLFTTPLHTNLFTARRSLATDAAAAASPSSSRPPPPDVASASCATSLGDGDGRTGEEAEANGRGEAAAGDGDGDGEGEGSGDGNGDGSSGGDGDGDGEQSPADGLGCLSSEGRRHSRRRAQVCRTLDATQLEMVRSVLVLAAEQLFAKTARHAAEGAPSGVAYLGALCEAVASLSALLAARLAPTVQVRARPKPRPYPKPKPKPKPKPNPYPYPPCRRCCRASRPPPRRPCSAC